MEVWTGSSTDGTTMAGFTCNDWLVPAGSGYNGYSGEVGQDWTQSSDSPCGNEYPIYCFSPGDAAPPEGACCLADGSCAVQTQASCDSSGGTYQGDGTTCAPNPCPPPPAAPTVTTQTVTGIGTTTATGNGNITDLGAPDPTQHGVCWNTTGTPTIGGSKTEEGAASATGAFTSDMTGLSPNTTYYMRAYATNTEGTSYGSDVTFPTSSGPTKVDLTGPTSVTAGSVSTALTLTSQDAGGSAENVTADTKFDLSSNSTDTAVFYSDAAGTSVITQTTIANGTSTATFYYKDGNEGTPTIAAAWNSGGTDLGSDTLPVTVSLAAATLVTSTTVAQSFKDFKVTVTKIEMFNGTSWVEIFSGTAQLDMVPGGTFPGISDLTLPQGTYSQIRVTFRNSLPVTGTLSYGGSAYYTTAATFGGAGNIASDPSTNIGSQTVYTFKISEWGALNADVTETSLITPPITVDATTDYQPTLRFTISKTFLLKGSAGKDTTYYFALSKPAVNIILP